MGLSSGEMGAIIGASMNGIRGFQTAKAAGNNPWTGATKTGTKLLMYPGNNPANAPKGFEWKGQPGSNPGSENGNWYNPETGESLHPDLNHPNPIGSHWDYRDSSGKWWLILPDGSKIPK